jgi:hypothetical protein
LPRSSDEPVASISRKERLDDFYVGNGLKANKAANANFSCLMKVRADTNSNHLILIATLSPAILTRVLPK